MRNILFTLLPIILSCSQHTNLVEIHPPSTGEFLSSGREPIETIIRAWTTEDPTYTLQSVYDRAPVF